MGVVGGGGGQKFSLRRLQSMGKPFAFTQPLVEWLRSGHKVFDRRFESWSADCWRQRRRRIHPTGVRTADQKTLQSAALPFGHCFL